MNDLRFDWFPCFDNNEIVTLAHKVTEQVAAVEQKSSRGASAVKRRDNQRQIAQHLLSALYTAHTNDCAVSMPLRAKQYAARGGDTTKVQYSYDYMKSVYDHLLNHGWIIVVGKPADGHNTRIVAAGDLADQYDRIGLVWMKQELKPDSQLVQLRDVKRDEAGKPIRTGKSKKTQKYDLPVPDTADVAQHIENLRFINGELSKHCFHLDLSDDHMAQLQTEMSDRSAEDAWLPIQNVQLRRIFARGSMNKGGRFYGAFWQQIPERHRPHIRIDGYNTVEVDYSGIAIRIISAIAGKPLPVDIDPYDIGLPDWAGPDDPRRKTVKKTVNALINDEDGVFRIGVEIQKELGVSDTGFLSALRRTHPEVVDRLATGIGLEAQFIDSQIAETVMLEMMKDGIVVLPIHDSFRVRAGYEDWVSVVMSDAFRDFTGADVSVEADVVKHDEHYGLEPTTDTRPDEERYAEATYSGDKLYDKLMATEDSRMRRYLASWRAWRVHNDHLFSPYPLPERS